MSTTTTPDFKIALKDRRALLTPESEVPLTVIVEGIHPSLLEDGFDAPRYTALSEAEGWTPPMHLDREISIELNRWGYELVRYERVAIDVPDCPDDTTTVRYSVTVTGKEDDQE